jgi:hypothetical protein
VLTKTLPRESVARPTGAGTDARVTTCPFGVTMLTVRWFWLAT